MNIITNKRLLKRACKKLGIPLSSSFRVFVPRVGKQARDAIEAYQKRRKLAINGKFDAATVADMRLLLITPGEKALEHAIAWVGVKETSPNRSPEIDEMKRVLNGKTDRLAWCGDFVTFMFLIVGYDLRIGKTFNWRYCPSWVEAATRNTVVYGHPPARIIKASRVAPGTIALFDWDGDGVADHIGFVEKHYGLASRVIATPIATVEGNTENAVKRRLRSRSSIMMFVDVLDI